MDEVTAVNGEVACGAADVDSLLHEIKAEYLRGDTPAARPRPTGAKVPRAAPAPPVATDTENWDALPTMPAPGEAAPAPALLPAVVPPYVPVAGLPVIEDDPAVIAARANADRLAREVRDTAAQVAALEKSLGLKAGVSISSAASFDKAAAELLLAGRADSTAENFAKLESLRVHGRRLGLAAGMANTKLVEARAEVRRVLSAQAVAVEVAPADKAVAQTLLAFVAAIHTAARARVRVHRGGFEAPTHVLGGAYETGFLGTIPVDASPENNHQLAGLVRAGHLDRAEVMAAIPTWTGS